MHRLASAITCAVLAFTCQAISYSAMAADQSETFNPQPGQWSTMIAILDTSQNHYLIRTAVDDSVEACTENLQSAGKHIREANGRVWVNPAKTSLSYEKKMGYSEDGVKVLEIRCVLEPFSSELIKKLGKK